MNPAGYPLPLSLFLRATLFLLAVFVVMLYLSVLHGTKREWSASGTARVYNDEDFSLVADLTMTESNSTFVNDVIVTKTAAYFTDSFQPNIYKV